MHCNSLQYTAIHCNSLQHLSVAVKISSLNRALSLLLPLSRSFSCSFSRVRSLSPSSRSLSRARSLSFTHTLPLSLSLSLPLCLPPSLSLSPPTPLLSCARSLSPSLFLSFSLWQAKFYALLDLNMGSDVEMLSRTGPSLQQSCESWALNSCAAKFDELDAHDSRPLLLLADDHSHSKRV